MNITGSIKRRLALQLAAIAALLSLAFFLSVRAVAERAAEDTQDNILAASATSIADALYTETGQIRLELPYSALSMLGTISEDRVYYRVISDGADITGYGDLPMPKLENANLSPMRGDDVPHFETYDYRGEPVRSVVISRALSTGDHAAQVFVIVAQTRRGLAAISSQITGTAMVIGAVFFCVAVGLSLLAAQNALAPLQRLASSIERRGPNDLRPITAQTPVELVPLVDGLNSFMGRLRAALTRTEDLITEAAHRIRTPLATVRAQAEIIHGNMNRSDNRSDLRDMIRTVDASSRSAGQLLDHAMVTLRSDQLEPQEIDLKAMLSDTVAQLSPTAELKDIQIELALPGDAASEITGDPVLLQNAFRNILDNAIKYSAAETEIKISLTCGDEWEISFADQGRGFVAEDIGALKTRFARGSNVGDVIGSGLGLTIADDVARAHGGRLAIGRNSGGKGACVSLFLPLI